MKSLTTLLAIAVFVCAAIVNYPSVQKSSDPVAIDERRLWHAANAWLAMTRAATSGRAYCREVEIMAIIACFYLRPARVAQRHTTSTSAFRKPTH